MGGLQRPDTPANCHDGRGGGFTAGRRIDGDRAQHHAVFSKELTGDSDAGSGLAKEEPAGTGEEGGLTAGQAAVATTWGRRPRRATGTDGGDGWMTGVA